MSVVEIAKELISFDTSGPPTKERPLAMWIRDFLDDLGADTEIQEVAPDRANVVAKIGRAKSPGLLLSGHIDVVPPGKLDLWTVTSPFEPVIRDGKLYGRGACDMKGPDACILQAARELVKESFKRQLTLVFTSGEDTGGWFVTKVIEEGKVTTRDALFGVIPEPSMMRIIRCHKAAGGARIIIRGKAAHSSTPDRGINAILKGSDFIQEVAKFQDELNKTCHHLLGSTTLVPTLISGGFKSNIIPDLCEITLNCRLIPQHRGVGTLTKWLEELIGKCSGEDETFKAEIVDVNVSEPLEVSEDSEIIRILKNLLKTEPIGAPYYTEAPNYTKAGIPTVICGPGDIEQAHTPNEYITLEQLSYGVAIFKNLVQKVCI